MSRLMAVTEQLLRHSADITPERISAVEGVLEAGELTVKTLQVGKEILLLEVSRKQGQVDPPHKHDDHESCGYLISGKMRIVVGDSEFIAGPGSSWRHPRGVIHSSEALTDCLQVEIKSPPRKTWISN